MSELRGVLFDLDGTLIDSEGLWADAEIAVATAGGVLWDEVDAAAWFGRPLRDTAQAIVDRGLDVTADLAIESMLDHVAAAYEREVAWLPGARELVEKLGAADVRTAIATMSFRRVALQAARAAGAGAIDVVVGGDELSRGKPDPEVFETAMSRLRLAPADVVVIEDSPTGVAAAVASRAAVLAVPPTETVRDSVSEFPGVSVVRSLRQVDVPLLRRMCDGERIDLWVP